MDREKLVTVWHSLRRHADHARCIDDDRGRAVVRATLGSHADAEMVAVALEHRGGLRRDDGVWMVATRAQFDEARAVFGDALEQLCAERCSECGCSTSLTTDRGGAVVVCVSCKMRRAA